MFPTLYAPLFAASLAQFPSTQKPINEIKPGDQVLSADPKTGRRGAKTVLQVWLHDDTLTDLVVDGGKVTTTEDHPFWSVTDGRFEGADELAPGEKVLGASGRPVLVTGLAPRSAHQARAYNLTIADIHTYYVLAGPTPILVHNANGAPPGVWSIDPDKSPRIANGGPFGKNYYEQAPGTNGDAYWWSPDQGDHGGSTWKVYKEKAKELYWVADTGWMEPGSLTNGKVRRGSSYLGRTCGW